MKKNVLIAVFSGVLFSQGCASIFCGASKTVTIKSDPPQAKFIIKDRDGMTIHSGETPATVSLKRGGGYFRAADYTIEFDADGFDRNVMPIKSGVEWGWYGFGNLIWLPIGSPIAWFIIDPITGGMYTMEDVNAKLSLATVAEMPSVNSDTKTSKKIRRITGYRVISKPGDDKFEMVPVYE